MDGQKHDVGRWDLLIAHPPCTYLSNVATRSFSLRCTPAEKVVKRWEDRAKGAVLFMRFLTANAERIAIENPVGFMNTAYRKPDQTIHPYMFASGDNDRENYVTKATCLWLKNLPKLCKKTVSQSQIMRSYSGCYRMEKQELGRIPFPGPGKYEAKLSPVSQKQWQNNGGNDNE